MSGHEMAAELVLCGHGDAALLAFPHFLSMVRLHVLGPKLESGIALERLRTVIEDTHVRLQIMHDMRSMRRLVEERVSNLTDSLPSTLSITVATEVLP